MTITKHLVVKAIFVFFVSVLFLHIVVYSVYNNDSIVVYSLYNNDSIVVYSVYNNDSIVV